MKSVSPKHLVPGLALVAALAAAPAFASGTFVQKTSSHGFAATVSALKRSVSASGLMVMGQVNQARVLSMTGLRLEGAHAFLVGNPTLGKKLFSMNPAVGAVVPVRVYVWASGGAVHVGYFRPSDLLTSISPKLARPGHMLDKKLAAILDGATR